jgi:hypothetical protein
MIAVRSQTGKIVPENLCQKISNQKRVGCMDQVVECLLSKCKDIELKILVLSPHQKKKKEEEEKKNEDRKWYILNSIQVTGFKISRDS